MKRAWQYRQAVADGSFRARDFSGTPGIYRGTRLGLVSLGAIGRTLCQRLAQLPNVFLTPHIAGSMGRECHRLGETAVAACERLLRIT